MADNSIRLNSWDEVNIVVPPGSEEYITTCPACSHNRKPQNQKVKCFSITTTKFNNEVGHCNHCGAKYYVPRNTINMPQKKEFKIPQAFNSTNLPDKAVEWFKNKRGISQQTLIDLKIGFGNEWMPQDQKERETIQFNYFIGEEIVNIKYRTSDKHFKLYKDAKLVFYNLDAIKNEKECIITEGEMGVLTWHEIKKTNVISVPNGANISIKEKEEFEKTNKFSNTTNINLEYLDNCYDYLKNIEKFYIATDNDPAGIKLRNELIRRLGPEKCVIISFGEYKDENEVLVKKSPESLLKCFNEAESPPIYDVHTINDDFDQVIHEFRHGFEKGLPLGLPSLDKHYTTKLGELDVDHGIPGHGKTSFQMFKALVCTVKYKWKWGIFMPENKRSMFWRVLIEMLVGKTADKDLPGCMNEMELKEAVNYLSNYFYFIDPAEFVTVDYILEKFKELVLVKGINGCMAGPWNSMRHIKNPGETQEDYLQRRLSEIRVFTKNQNIKFNLEAHPIVIRDTEKYVNDKGEPYERIKVPTSYDLSGGAMWYNRVDNIKAMYRDNRTYGKTEIHVQKIKYEKIVGVTTHPDKPVILDFDPKTNRFSENGICPLDDLKVVQQELKIENDVPF